MDAFVSAVDELEASVERNDVESVDINKLRNLLKAVGDGVNTDDATTLKNLGLRIWNACVNLSKSQTFSIVNIVKVNN